MRKQKRKHIVVPRSESVLLDGIKTSKGKLDFKGKTAMWVDDDLASEINTQHGEKGSNDLWVCEDERLGWHEMNDRDTDGNNRGIHHYTFSGVDMTGIKREKQSRYVWVRRGRSQVRVLREEAEENGEEIVE